mgnify:CR=1 FL=1
MKLLRILANKYLITAVAFAVWMFFFDRNDFFTQRDRRVYLYETERHIAYLREEIAAMEREYHALRNDPRKLEQYARERYRMKRQHEDVYVVE